VNGNPSHAATEGMPGPPPLPLGAPLEPLEPAVLAPPFAAPLDPLAPALPLTPLAAPLLDAAAPELPPSPPLPLVPVVEGAAPLPFRPSLALLPQPPEERMAAATAPAHASRLHIVDARARPKCARDVSSPINIAPLRGNATTNATSERRCAKNRRSSQ